MNLTAIRDCLASFVHDQMATGSKLLDICESDGHAGLTYLFNVAEKGGSPRAYVLKIPPAGVKFQGNTDVYRQAPLLNALHAQGLPVPRVPFAFTDNPWFDRPFIVMERLPGRVFFVWQPHPSFERTGEKSLNIWRQCVTQLAAVHQFDYQQYLPDWEPPEPLGNNLGRWRKVYQHALEASWARLAEKVERQLADFIPSEYTVGLFHGDYQPGNLLYQDHEFVAIIDWELAGISAQELDLGWLLMVADPQNWLANFHPISPISEAEVLEIYQDTTGRAVADYAWFQAFAGFRLASIACLNHKLHITGKRSEPVWKDIGQCIVPMLNRAQALLSEYR